MASEWIIFTTYIITSERESGATVALLSLTCTYQTSLLSRLRRNIFYLLGV